MTPQNVPDAIFHTRVRNPALGGDNPFEWKDVTTEDVFAEPEFRDNPPSVPLDVSGASFSLVRHLNTSSGSQ